MNQIEKLIIDAPVPLEARFRQGNQARGLVIAHPHPQYGGDMDNNVVVALEHLFAGAGWSTLVFNFRGVGRSAGAYDQGRGEVDDLTAALAFVRRRGIQDLALAGYSFGAWIVCRAQAAGNLPSALPLLLVAPPLTMLDFPPVSLPGLRLVVAGERDAIAPFGPIQKQLPLWNPEARLLQIPMADHFFAGPQFGAELQPEIRHF